MKPSEDARDEGSGVLISVLASQMEPVVVCGLPRKEHR